MPTACRGLRQAAAAEKALLRRSVTEAQPDGRTGVGAILARLALRWTGYLLASSRDDSAIAVYGRAGGVP